MLQEAIADRAERGAESFLLIALREAAADQVERYIALLDLIDGDPDLEPESDEPDADIEGRAW